MRISGYHAYHTIVNGIDGIHKIVLNLFRQFHLRCLNVFSKELNVALYALVFVFKVSLPVCHQLFKSFDVLLWQCEHHHSLERNGVAHVSSMPRSKTCIEVGYCLSHETHH